MVPGDYSSMWISPNRCVSLSALRELARRSEFNNIAADPDAKVVCDVWLSTDRDSQSRHDVIECHAERKGSYSHTSDTLSPESDRRSAIVRWRDSLISAGRLQQGPPRALGWPTLEPGYTA